MMTVDQLRVSIYQQLFSGRLTKQKKSDGDVLELLDSIGKVNPNFKKVTRISRSEDGNFYETQGKNVRCVTDELPYDIPENWEWVHLNEIAISGLGKTLNKTKDTGASKSYLCSINVYWDGIHLDEVKTAAFSDDDIEKYRLQKGDLLICEGGDAGRTAIWESDEEMYYQNALHRVRFFGGIDPYYFRTLMEYYKLNGTIQAYCKGMTIKHLVQGSLNAMYFPLPPLEEQKRIVAKIEELMPFVEQYAKVSTRLNTLNASFPDQMKKSILQQAVMGKLVPQDPSDEPASVLLEKIAEEKQKLIKEGKIKKQKAMPAITEDEIPFDIPESWEWVRWGTIAQIIQYGFNAPAQETGRIKMVRISDIQNNQVQWETVPYCEIDEKEISNYLLEENDILFARTGGTVGKSFLVKGVEQEAIYAGYLIRTRYSQRLCPDYLKLFMESDLYWRQLRNGTIATAQPNCNGQTLSKMLIPIPPAEEQNRIASEVQKYSLSVKELHAKAN